MSTPASIVVVTDQQVDRRRLARCSSFEEDALERALSASGLCPTGLPGQLLAVQPERIRPAFGRKPRVVVVARRAQGHPFAPGACAAVGPDPAGPM